MVFISQMAIRQTLISLEGYGESIFIISCFFKYVLSKKKDCFSLARILLAPVKHQKAGVELLVEAKNVPANLIRLFLYQARKIQKKMRRK